MRLPSSWFLVVLQLPGLVALADPKPMAPPVPPSCRVLNDSDHAVKLYDGIEIGSWRMFSGTQKINDGKQTFDLTCDAQDHVMKLVGTQGALSVEPLPMWFRTAGNWDGTVWVAAKKGAKVEVDGKPVKLAKTEITNVPLDARARLLGSDLATIHDQSSRGDRWSIPVDVAMTAGTETGTVTIRTEPYRAVNQLLRELGAAETKPVAWAAPPDKAGPAAILGCESSRATQLPSYDLVRSPAKLIDLSLVAVCHRKVVTVEKCPPSTDEFAHGEQVERKRIDGAIKLLEAKTGKIVATTTLTGSDPAACRDSAMKAIVGDPPTKREIALWIDTIQ